MPGLYMIHGIAGVLALLAATIHKFSSTTFHPIIRNTGNGVWYLAIIVLLFAILFLSGWLTEGSRVFYRLKKRLEHAFNHQLNIWIHRLNFVVIGLIWLHVHVIPRLASVPYFALVFDIYTLVFIGVYTYQKIIGNERKTGIVVENKSLTPTIQKITVKLNQDVNTYNAGDFYFLSFNSKSIPKESHPFSIVSPANQEHINFLIQKLGDYTEKIDKVEIGTLVHLEGPLVMYALSTGIAPLRSIAKEYAGKRRIHLIWSTNTSQPYLTSELRDLQTKGVVLDVQEHRFSDPQLRTILSKEEIQQASFLLVGSNRIVPILRKRLRKFGVGNSRIIDEHITM